VYLRLAIEDARLGPRSTGRDVESRGAEDLNHLVRHPQYTTDHFDYISPFINHIHSVSDYLHPDITGATKASSAGIAILDVVHCSKSYLVASLTTRISWLVLLLCSPTTSPSSFDREADRGVTSKGILLHEEQEPLVPYLLWKTASETLRCMRLSLFACEVGLLTFS